MKNIIKLALLDLVENGYIFEDINKETREVFNLVDNNYELENYSHLGIYFLVIKELKALDTIDLEFIHNVLLDDLPSNRVELEKCSIIEEVQIG
ncbi:hypothetical protein CPG38_06880 [Malaciobacter marinus]|uniref:hypothetical protein n=1 Tax=Malaciobacter marinus TaxID=505249 RepID=UPI000C0895BF|nr:hypothetical protein [Malaciobacter marinus]PHO12566.1 hypothetical protein CPG38_06880 [Malaciobacter marinus]